MAGAGARPRGATDPPGELKEGARTLPPPAPRTPPRALSASTYLTSLRAAAVAAAPSHQRTLPRPPLRRPRPRSPGPAFRSTSREKSWPTEGPRRPRAAHPQRAYTLNAPAPSALRPCPPQPVPCGAVFTTRDRSRPPGTWNPTPFPSSQSHSARSDVDSASSGWARGVAGGSRRPSAAPVTCSYAALGVFRLVRKPLRL